MKKNVLGVKIDDVTVDQAVVKVEKWMKGRRKHYIVTPNPEFLVAAQRDKLFRQILNKADLAIPDGRGLRLFGDIVCNTPGIDLVEALVKMASENGFTVAFLGGRGKVAEETGERLQKRYPKLKITFADPGGEIDKDGNGSLKLPSPADLLFVAFGPPKQEKWIFKNLSKMSIKVAMGVGGSFDLISGRIPRAPKWIRYLGFEWLFRLAIQPWRLKRQLALLKYLWLLWNKRMW